MKFGSAIENHAELSETLLPTCVAIMKSLPNY
jgi:hypothetical protein